MVIISSKCSLLLGSLLTFKITYMLSSKVNNRRLFTVAVINMHVHLYVRIAIHLVLLMFIT